MTREWLCLILPGLFAAQACGSADVAAALARVRAEEKARIAVFDAAARTVVCVFDDEQRGGGGSGVLISPDGYGLTNVHVVASFLESRRGFGGLSDGDLYPLEVIGIDPGGDIALFRLSGREQFAFAPLGDSDRLVVGEWVAAMGNPFLLADDLTPTVTLGVVSGLHRYQAGQGNMLEYADCIQVSSSINPGNSGGPLFNLRGEVIGINGRASFEERGRVNVGVGYAVTINQVKRFLPCLMAGRLCEHGTLGATVIDDGGKLIFNAVETGATADRAGIELGDELLALGGGAVRTANEVNNRLAILPADWPVRIRIRRDGDVREVADRLDRLMIRQKSPWLIDWKQNHAFARRVFSGSAALRGVPHDRRPSALRCRWTPRDGASVAAELLISDSGEESVRTGGADAAAPPSAGALLSALAALLAPPRIGVGWEVRGGDEVDGRTVIVIERRSRAEDTPRTAVRWKFDAESGDIREITLLTESGAQGAAWRPVAQPAAATEPPAPPPTEAGLLRLWRDSDGGTLELLDVEWTPVPAGGAQ
ncbi:MAG: trypsin-like peptidase domain-containing protein [Phycisphaerales bacterium]|nr:trypsin-like peptidase domain-containing protein [Phycisphaerales bacterium]